MKRKYYGVIVGCVLVGVVIGGWFAIHSAVVDRFAPWRTVETDYAVIPAKARKVANVLLVKPSGHFVSYRVSFQGWGESNRYIAVTHKGRYVKSVHYLPSGKIPQKARKVLTMKDYSSAVTASLIMNKEVV